MNATSGKFYELVFGSFEAFRRWVFTRGELDDLQRSRRLTPPWKASLDAGVVDDDGGEMSDGSPTDDDEFERELREIYDGTELIPGYEAYVGHREGDAQICNGDSGGPLVRSNAKGELVVVGVASGTLDSNRLVCDFGGVYAVFNQESKRWLSKRKGWTDPCESVPSGGMCEAGVATRCTTAQEGRRRLLQTDCTLFGQTCALAANDEAVCVAPGEEPIVRADPPTVPFDACASEGDDSYYEDDEAASYSYKEYVARVLMRARAASLGHLKLPALPPLETSRRFGRPRL